MVPQQGSLEALFPLAYSVMAITKDIPQNIPCSKVKIRSDQQVKVVTRTIYSKNWWTCAVDSGREERGRDGDSDQ